MELKLRCYVEKNRDYWHAVCLDLDLYEIGASKEDAKLELLNHIVASINLGGGVELKIMTRIHYYVLRVLRYFDQDMELYIVRI